MSDLPPNNGSHKQRVDVKDFILAAIRGDLKKIQEYVFNNGDIEASDSFGFTALSTAAYNCRKEIVEFLILNGADINRSNKIHISPLHVAAGRGHTEIMKLLLEQGANKDAQDNSGDTPLHWAITRGSGESLETVKLLLAHGADLTITNNEQKTPLSNAEERIPNDPKFQAIAELLQAHMKDSRPRSPKIRP